MDNMYHNGKSNYGCNLPVCYIPAKDRFINFNKIASQLIINKFGKLSRVNVTYSDYDALIRIRPEVQGQPSMALLYTNKATNILRLNIIGFFRAHNLHEIGYGPAHYEVLELEDCVAVKLIIPVKD